MSSSPTWRIRRTGSKAPRLLSRAGCTLPCIWVPLRGKVLETGGGGHSSVLYLGTVPIACSVSSVSRVMLADNNTAKRPIPSLTTQRPDHSEQNHNSQPSAPMHPWPKYTFLPSIFTSDTDPIETTTVTNMHAASRLPKSTLFHVTQNKPEKKQPLKQPSPPTQRRQHQRRLLLLPQLLIRTPPRLRIALHRHRLLPKPSPHPSLDT